MFDQAPSLAIIHGRAPTHLIASPCSSCLSCDRRPPIDCFWETSLTQIKWPAFARIGAQVVVLLSSAGIVSGMRGERMEDGPEACCLIPVEVQPEHLHSKQDQD